MVNFNHGKVVKIYKHLHHVYNLILSLYTSITHLIELAEEKTGCGALIVSIDRKNYKENLSTILRAFMYLGFEMVDPAIYRQEPGYLLVGYEL